MNKIATTISQSDELLSLGVEPKTADMHYVSQMRDVPTSYELGLTDYTSAQKWIGTNNVVEVKPAWSLSALLNMIPLIEGDSPMLMKTVHGDWWIYCRRLDFDSNSYEDPIDAVYEFVCWLKNEKLI